MITRHNSIFPRCLLAGVLVLGIGISTVSCNSSSPTEPDTVAPASNSAPGSSNSADSSGDSGVSSTEGQPGSLTIHLTDLPTDEICELWVYFSELRVKPDGGPPEFVLPGFSGQAYDLLTLRNGNEEEMGQFDIEQRKYQFIEILLDQSLSYVVEKDPEHDCASGTVGDTVALQIPSQKFKVKGDPFTVGTNTNLTIDFDADKSLKPKGSSKNPKGWMLKADVSIVSVE